MKSDEELWKAFCYYVAFLAVWYAILAPFVRGVLRGH